MLVQYVKNKHGQRIGCVVALSEHQIGWSLCKVKLDKFSKDKAIQIAKGRAERYCTANLFMHHVIVGNGISVEQQDKLKVNDWIPQTLHPYMIKMYYRARDYFTKNQRKDN